MSKTLQLAKITQYLSSNNVELTLLADGSGVLLDLEGHQVLSLNNTGATIAQALLQEKKDINDVIAEFSDEYEITQDQAKTDIAEFLDEMHSALCN